MQPTVLPPQVPKLNTRASRPAFSVVVIHDGFFAGIRAMEALEWLRFTLCPDLQVYPISWSFDKLARSDIRATACRAAAAADLLIISAADESALPDHIKQWLDSIPAQQRQTRPLVVALHAEDIESNAPQGPLCAHLKEVAASWQTDFMCNEDFDQRMDRDFATQLLCRKSPTSVHRTQPFEGEFRAAPRYWGING